MPANAANEQPSLQVVGKSFPVYGHPHESVVDNSRPTARHAVAGKGAAPALSWEAAQSGGSREETMPN